MDLYPIELTAQGLAEQRKARIAAILEPDLPTVHNDPVWTDIHRKLDAGRRLREIAAEFV